MWLELIVYNHRMRNTIIKCGSKGFGTDIAEGMVIINHEQHKLNDVDVMDVITIIITVNALIYQNINGKLNI